MKQGIQTNFPHEKLREYGCYFFDLCRWAELVLDISLTNDQIINFFDIFKAQGFMEDDAFVINPVEILNILCDGQRRFRSIRKTVEKTNEKTYVVYLKKPEHGHFVLSHNGEIWDSLNPERPGVKDYRVDSYRVIV